MFAWSHLRHEQELMLLIPKQIMVFLDVLPEYVSDIVQDFHESLNIPDFSKGIKNYRK